MISGRNVVVSFATVTELRYGATKAGWGDLRRRTLENRIAEITVVTPDDGVRRVPINPRTRRPRSRAKIHEADRWIAVSALYLRVELVSDDNVYRKAPGLPLRSTRVV